jgi:hypothetical protein
MLGRVIVWTYVFCDRPEDSFDVAAAFWTAVTGTRLSPRRGDGGEFATFMPETGDAHFKIQGVYAHGGAHLDLVSDDPSALIATAVGFGAEIVTPHDGWAVLRSPGGQLFCVTPYAGERVRSDVVAGPDGTTSRVDQIAIDVAGDAYEAEAAFWAAVTGWPSHRSSRTEFHIVQQPDHLPVRVLVQRLDTPRPTSAHLDLACSDVAAVAEWHVRLGAEVVGVHANWTVMRDPVGGVYCLTRRNPKTGRLD